MPSRARLTARARREAHEAAAWIAENNRSAARALLRSVDALLILIGEHPLVGTVRPELAPSPYRFSVVRGFPYLMVYDPTSRPPTVVRIVHGARDLPDVLKDL
jgi:plasmid stabilization system protein ParE